MVRALHALLNHSKNGVCQVKGGVSYQPITFVLDPTLRVFQVFPITNPSEHVNQVMAFLQTLPPPEPHRMADRQAPVLLIPRVFEPTFCQHLIQQFEADGGEDSGFMRDQDGKTIGVTDYSFKKRRDLNLADKHPEFLQTINDYMLQRVKPEIEKVFQFSVTRFERTLSPATTAKPEASSIVTATTLPKAPLIAASP